MTSRRNWAQSHQRLVGGVVLVEGAMDLGQSQLHPVPFEQRNQQQELVAVKGALILADHDRVEPTAWIYKRGEQRSSLRPLRPGELAGAADLEELGHDPPWPAIKSRADSSCQHRDDTRS
jgi:hypothetical protein